MKRAAFAMGFFLVGCATVRPIARNAELLVYPRFVPHSQAIVLPYSFSSIATLDIIPYVEDTPGVFKPISSTTGNATVPEDPNLLKLTQASPSIDPNRPFVIQKLKPNKTYRVYAKAYDLSNTIISKDTSSYVEVAVGNNDSPAMATLPVQLTDVPFGANTSVTINTQGKCDYLKSTLYLLSNNAQVSVGQTTRNSPTLDFTNLQGNTSYKLVAEAYKFGGVVASNSVTIAVTNDNAPATQSMTITIPFQVATLAGGAGGITSGYLNGTGTAAKFYRPYAVTTDPSGNVFVADTLNHVIRKITSDGVVTTFAGGAGSNTSGYADGSGTAAKFNSPYGLAFDGSGNLFVADMNNNLLRKITPDGVVSTFAGGAGGITAGYAEGTGTAAKFNSPYDITIDGAGNVYVADYGGSIIRKVTSSGVTSLVAGQYGLNGYVNGAGASSKFYYPRGIAVDGSGNLYVADYYNSLIRKITSGGVVSTFAGGAGGTISGFADGTGTAAKLNCPFGLAFDSSGNLYVADQQSYIIRKITPDGVVSTFAGGAGTTTPGHVNGMGTAATFDTPSDIAIDGQGNMYVADTWNNLIRVMK